MCNEYSSLEDWSINEEQFTKNYLLLIIPTLSSVYNLYEFRCKLLSDHRVRSILRVSVVVVNTLEQIQDRYTNFVWNTTFYLKAVKINNHWSNKISFFLCSKSWCSSFFKKIEDSWIICRSKKTLINDLIKINTKIKDKITKHV